MSVEIDGVQLADQLRGRQVPLLLAYLVLNRSRDVGREELIGALWPYDAPRSQDAALRTLLSRLRSALGTDVLGGRDELILQLPEPVWIDLEAARVEVQRARETLELGDARGAWAIAQVPLNIASRGLLPGSQASWLEPPRRELEDVRLQALEVIGRAGLRLGGTQLASVERAARNLIESEPYRESGYVLMMEALAAQGNFAEGLRVFDRLRTLLRDELGIAPSPEMIAAHDRLLHPDTHGAAGTAPAGTNIELPAELKARATTPLVGRKAELEELGRLWSMATGERPAATVPGGPAAGFGRIVLLMGDPGIGKTRLAAELACQLHDAGAIVLAGRAPEENVVPYQPFLEALRHYFLSAPIPDLRSDTREYGAELARLIPELRRRLPELPQPDAGEPETERYRLFEAVVGLLTAMSSSRPILMVLDDLQWADRPSLLLLRHLARAPDPARLLIVGAYRGTESVIEGFTELLAGLQRERLVTQIDVSGLSVDETSDLVRLRTGETPSRAFSRALHAETEGNPLFIEEIVRHLTEAGVKVAGAGAAELHRARVPEGVKQVIARRLARFDPQAMEWLRVAAVIGRDFDTGLLERVVSLDEEQFLNAVDAALEEGLVVETAPNPGRYSFSHALIRETLYEGMSAPRRARIHRHVGEALEETASEREVTALAHHFTRAASAEDAEKAVTYAWRAGDRAAAVLAHEEAAEHYSRALEVLERFSPDEHERRCGLMLLLGEARVRSGERALAWAALSRAAELADRLGDSAAMARAAIAASHPYVQQPGVIDTDVIRLLERALEVHAEDRGSVYVRLLACLCGALYYTTERDRMRVLSSEAWTLAQELGDPESRAYACGARRRALWDVAHLNERLRMSTEMLTLARQAGNLELELQAHAWLVVDLLEHGDADAVDAQIEAFSAGAERLRQPLYEWQATVWRAMRALLSGQLEPADAFASDALATGVSADAVTASQYYAIQLLAIRRERARIAELELAARQMVADNPHRPAWRAALATLLLESGRTEEARAELEVLAAQDFGDIPHDGDWMIAMTLLSEVCTALSDTARAALLYDQLLPYAETNVVIGIAAVCLGSAARFLGRLAATLERDSESVAHFERALEANRKLQTPVFLAHTQLDYARSLGGGRRTTALVAAAAKTAAEFDLPVITKRLESLQKR